MMIQSEIAVIYWFIYIKLKICFYIKIGQQNNVKKYEIRKHCL